MFPCLGTRFNPRAVGLEANRFVCIFRKERQTTESISWQIISRIANKICRSIVKSSIGTCNCLSTGALVAIFAASPHLKVLFFFYRIIFLLQTWTNADQDNRRTEKKRKILIIYYIFMYFTVSFFIPLENEFTLPDLYKRRSQS